MRRHGLVRALVAVCMLAAVLAAGTAGATSASAVPAPVGPTPDSAGQDFWLGFNTNSNTTPTLSILVASATETTGTVSVPGLDTPFSEAFSVAAGGQAVVTVPVGAMMTGTGSTQDFGVHVVAEAEVEVFGLNRQTNSTDGFLGLPVDALGTEYLVLGLPQSSDPAFSIDQLGIVATEDTTSVTLTPVGGSPTVVSLDQGQTHQVQAADLTGMSVVADKPISVFGGNRCAFLPADATTGCDHLVEQLPPVDSWGSEFVMLTAADRPLDDPIRILASEDGTTVSIDGSEVATLDAGEAYTGTVAAGSHHIVADAPVLVAQYVNGRFYEQDQAPPGGDPVPTTYDPFMALVVPIVQFESSYVLSSPASAFTHHLNVVVPTTSVGNVTLDGSAIDAGSFSAIGSSGYSGAQVNVAPGAHVLAGDAPFGVMVHAFDDRTSYAYPAGAGVEEQPVLSSVVLTPETAARTVLEQHCVTATTKDHFYQPVVGVDVGFTVNGANPSVAAGTTDDAGETQYCYTGNNAGTDDITASAESFEDTAQATWATQAPSNEAWTRAIFNDYLNRAASPNDQSYYDRLLDEKTFTRRSLAAAVGRTPESDRRIVDALYQLVFDRNAGTSGQRTWTRELDRGVKPAEIAVKLFGSAEFYANSGGTPEGFVEQLYQRVLGRSAGSGSQTWVNELNAGRSRASVAAKIYGSRESRERRVIGLYQRFLQRNPDASGLNAFAIQLRDGDDLAIASRLAGSAEYYQKAAARFPA